MDAKSLAEILRISLEDLYAIEPIRYAGKAHFLRRHFDVAAGA